MAIILAIHNIMRWIVILAGAAVLTFEYIGLLGKHAWKPANRILGIGFRSALDVQLLLGILLMFSLHADEFGMFLVTHVAPMLVAVALAHIGGRMVGRGATDGIKHRRAAIWYSVVLFVILMSIPWWRPLLPGM